MKVRHAGVNIPLFSARSSASWGIGELPDVVPLVEWLHSSGFDRLLLLPLGTMPPGQTSPYAAVSTMAIDPLYVRLTDIPDFVRAGGVEALSPDARTALAEARESRTVRHDLVSRAKDEALALAFRSFQVDEWAQLTPRASALAGYVARERWWLDDYALFQVLAAQHQHRSWREWPVPLRDRDPRALDDARRQLSREVLEQQYRQWIAETQWMAARGTARRVGVELFGDLPFVASADSPEIWAHAADFRLDVSVGVPPDAFSPTGQDWGLPMYHWSAIAESNFAWLRQRSRRMSTLFDGVRVDHVIGLYRTYGRTDGESPFFSPAAEVDQVAQGQAVMSVLAENGLSLIAEDLGVVPDFLRPSLAGLGIPGCRVFRWERDWHAHGAPFVEPSTYPAVSAAMSGTHDTEPMSVWWDTLPACDREAFLQLGAMTRHAADAGGPWSPALRDAFLALAYAAGADDVFFPIQDLFGWRDRVNVPGTVGPENWTWAVPWPVDQFPQLGPARERAAFLRMLAASTGRGRSARLGDTDT